MLRKLIGLLTAGGLCLAGATLPAQADNLSASFTTVPRSWLGNLSQALVITSGGSSSLSFFNTSIGTVSVTYTAECQLNGASSSWLHVSVVIDGVVTPPSGPDAAFCSGQGVGVTTGWARHSITVARVLASGVHSVSVRGQVAGVHAGARIDDSTILVTR